MAANKILARVTVNEINHPDLYADVSIRQDGYRAKRITELAVYGLAMLRQANATQIVSTPSLVPTQAMLQQRPETVAAPARTQPLLAAVGISVQATPVATTESTHMPSNANASSESNASGSVYAVSSTHKRGSLHNFNSDDIG